MEPLGSCFEDEHQTDANIERPTFIFSINLPQSPGLKIEEHLGDALLPLADPLILIYLFNDPRRDQGQQDFVMPHQVYSPTAFGGGPVDNIGEGAIVLDEIQVDRCKIFQGIP